MSGTRLSSVKTGLDSDPCQPSVQKGISVTDQLRDYPGLSDLIRAGDVYVLIPSPEPEISCETFRLHAIVVRYHFIRLLLLYGLIMGT